MHKIIPLLLVFSLVFLSGCVGQTGGGPGVQITSFSFSDSSTVGGSAVYLTLEVENKGGFKAGNVAAELRGLPDSIWRIAEGRSRSLGELCGVSSDMTQGCYQTMTWTLTPTDLPVDQSYEANVKVSYGYQTSYVATIRAQSLQDKRDHPNRQTGIINPKSSAGPITMTARLPTTLFTGATIPVYFDIQNNGGGFVDGDALTFNPQGGLSCTNPQVQLRKGISGILVCQLSTGGATDFVESSITLSTGYRYSVESVSSVTVKAKPPI